MGFYPLLLRRLVPDPARCHSSALSISEGLGDSMCVLTCCPLLGWLLGVRLE